MERGVRRKSHAPCEVGEKVEIASKPYLSLSEKDGVWDSSYVSTGVRDVAGVENVLGSNAVRYGDSDNTSDLGNGQTSYGYAIKGVVFTYVKIADIFQYEKAESGSEHEIGRAHV